ncbi:hypothetical protein HDU78_008211 [Chytriomyces hyalinus]|nr:hypothetical protein HDU78_008211 [Chytriomyces hyalinus]
MYLSLQEVDPDVMNLEDLSFHDNESAEHDVSFTRRDTFFGTSSHPEPEYVNALMNASADGESLTVADLVKHRLTRFNHSLEHNPDLTFWGGQLLSCCIETYLIANVFGRNGKISIQDARAFLGEERIPADYVRPDSLVSGFSGVLDTRIVPIMAKWEWTYWFNNPVNSKNPLQPFHKLPADPREFELVQVPSNEIDKHMIIGNESNMDARVPKQWHGLWYTCGNPSADECISMANGTWVESENAYYLPVYQEKIWGWDDTKKGRDLYAQTRFVATNYKMTFDSESGIGRFNPVMKLGTEKTHLTIELSDFWGKFVAEPTENPNIFLRKTSFFGRDPAVYRLIRIVNGDGTRTPEFDSIYLKKIDNPSKDGDSPYLTHLTSTQLLAVRKE